LLRKTNEFEARHDLRLLAKMSGFYQIVPAIRARHFVSIFETVNQRWRSNHRYYSERQLLDFMNAIRAEHNIRGERWKNLSRTIYNGAFEIIKQGEELW
jgi:hypothetical protein